MWIRILHTVFPVRFQCHPNVHVLRRQLLAHLGFEDVLPPPDGGNASADGAADLAAAAESLQLTSPRSAPGASPPRAAAAVAVANGNAFGDDGACLADPPPCACLLHVVECVTVSMKRQSCDKGKGILPQQACTVPSITRIPLHAAPSATVSCCAALISEVRARGAAMLKHGQQSLKVSVSVHIVCARKTAADRDICMYTDAGAFFENLPEQAEAAAASAGVSRSSTLSPRPATGGGHDEADKVGWCPAFPLCHVPKGSRCNRSVVLPVAQTLAHIVFWDAHGSRSTLLACLCHRLVQHCMLPAVREPQCAGTVQKDVAGKSGLYLVGFKCMLWVRCAAAPHGRGGGERGRHTARAVRRQLRRRARHLPEGAPPSAVSLSCPVFRVHLKAMHTPPVLS